MSSIRYLLPLCALLCTGTAHAQRVVVVNGIALTGAQILHVDRLNCAPVPSGHYWLNTRTGAWGYAGSPMHQGFIGDPCPRSRQGLSQRQRLYLPGELLRGRP